MATITITYTKPVAVSAVPKNEICATFVPTNAACDNAAFDGTYYDTNVPGYGECMTAEEIFFKQIAHPGLVAALRAAMRAQSHSYTWAAVSADDVLYVEELNPALKDQGFTLTVGE